MRISDWSSDVCSSDLPHALARDTIGGLAGDILPLKHHAPRARGRKPDDAAQRRAFPGAVAPQQANRFALFKRQRYALQRMAFAIISMDIVDFQNHDANSSSASPR